jgi:hypothetical protein
MQPGNTFSRREKTRCSSACGTASLPGIAVRRTASLPLAFARQSIILKEHFAKKMDARVEPAHDKAA